MDGSLRFQQMQTRGQVSTTLRQVPHRRQRRLCLRATLAQPEPRSAVKKQQQLQQQQQSSQGSTQKSIFSKTPQVPGLLGGSVAVPNVPNTLHGRDVELSAMRACIKLHQSPLGNNITRPAWQGDMLDKAYERCGLVCSEYAKTFYLGTQLMTPKQSRAIWAIYVWCRRTDELVDGPNASRITPQALDRWEERLEAVFQGRPYDELDAALTDTVATFPICIQPFRDMIEGMRMDLTKSRYQTFDELYEYCYRVAGTVALMTMPVMGIEPGYKGPMERVYNAALALGTANQLTNILRDVGEDANQRNRIYVPLEDLDKFGISEREVLMGLHQPTSGRIDPRWRAFMKFQISRAHDYFADAENGVDFLDSKARWPVWSALILYRQILDAIERNDYDNFSKRAYVPKWRKFASLPLALGRAVLPVQK